MCVGRRGSWERGHSAPLQAEGRQNPGPGALMLSDSSRFICQKLFDAESNVPGIVGGNNHMGSAFTAREDLMKIVLSQVYAAGFFSTVK
ncbi:MAG: hypothetical protein HKM06_05550 [Spirochaetales bacterium]|nr:hypothetical protein [Spirochaetales bacterium]